MVNKLVSILIVTYNAEKFIKTTLKSCLEQTYKNIEVLILDNNSSDNTIKIIKAFSDTRIKLFIGQENIGPYRGLNFLIDRASGQYIAIQDHDDVWFPEKLEKQISFLDNNTNFLACGTNIYYYFEKRKIFILSVNNFKTNFVDHISLVFRNRGLRYNTEYLLTDAYFQRNIIGKISDIACLPEPLAMKRVRSDGKNLSTYWFKYTRKNIKDFFEIEGFSLRNLVYLLWIAINKYCPESFVWFCMRAVRMIRGKKRLWLSGEEFNKKYPGINI